MNSSKEILHSDLSLMDRVVVVRERRNRSWTESRFKSPCTIGELLQSRGYYGLYVMLIKGESTYSWAQLSQSWEEPLLFDLFDVVSNKKVDPVGLLTIVSRLTGRDGRNSRRWGSSTPGSRRYARSRKQRSGKRDFFCDRTSRHEGEPIVKARDKVEYQCPYDGHFEGRRSRNWKQFRRQQRKSS